MKRRSSYFGTSRRPGPRVVAQASCLCLPVLMWCAALAIPASAQELAVGGDPLRIDVTPDGTIGVQRLQDQALVPQYYAGRAKGTVLFLDHEEMGGRWGNGTSTFALWDDAVTDRFANVSHDQPDAGSIRTRLAAGETGILVDQEVSYTAGNPNYQVAWTISNASQTTYHDLRLLHGGDVSPGGGDTAVGAWMGASNSVVATGVGAESNVWMTLSGEEGSRADEYYVAHFQLVRDACKAGDLPESVDATPHDAAYALLWTRNSLRPGQAWTVRAREQWPGSVAPAVHRDVTEELARSAFSWQISYQTGTYFGVLDLASFDAPRCTGPFWCVMESSSEQRFMQPDGTLPDGREYLDLTAQVEAALADRSLDPGDQLTIPGIEVYMRDRQPPPASLFTIWATAPESTL